MLYLTRYIRETIIVQLGNHRQIGIKVLDIDTNHKGKFAKIGIEAPKDLVVIREELIPRKPGERWMPV